MKQTFNYCILHTDLMTSESRIIAKFELIGDAAICATALNKGQNERHLYTVKSVKDIKKSTKEN